MIDPRGPDEPRWQKWFAWHPVMIWDDGWAWFRYVERVRNFLNDDRWLYRRIHKP